MKYVERGLSDSVPWRITRPKLPYSTEAKMIGRVQVALYERPQLTRDAIESEVRNSNSCRGCIQPHAEEEWRWFCAFLARLSYPAETFGSKLEPHISDP